MITFLKKHIANLLLALIFFIFLGVRLPDYLESKKLEGQKISGSDQVRLLDGTPLSLPLAQKQILVFWATWCGPCTVELSRINAMIEKNEIEKDAVIAVSFGEDPAKVSSVAKERGYHFRVVIDPAMDLRERFKVESTPTVLFIDETKTVRWKTVGISPTLGFRIKNFL